MRRTGQRVLLAVCMLVLLATLGGFAPLIHAYVDELRLIRQLDSQDFRERYSAASRLAELGSLRAIPELLRLSVPRWMGLDVDVSAHYQAALEELIARRGKPATVAILAALKDERGAVRVQAAHWLYKANPWEVDAVEPLLQALGDANPLVRVRAARVLWKLGNDAGKLLPIGMGALFDKEAGHEAAWLLWSLGRDAREATRALARRVHIERLKGMTDPAGEALVAIGCHAVPAVVEELLGDSDPQVRKTAVDILARMENDAASAIGPLVRTLADPDPTVREAATDALGRIGSAGEQAVPELVRFLSDGSTEAPVLAARCLGELGPPATAAVPALILAFEQRQDPLLRLTALRALAKLCPEPSFVIGRFMECLEDEDSSLRFEAAKALALLGPAAGPALGRLLERFTDEILDTRVWAAVAAIRIEPERGKNLVPEILQFFRSDPTPETAEALAQLGPLARGAAPVLIERMLEEPAGRRALGSLQEGTQAYLRALIEVGFEDKDLVPIVRRLRTGDFRERRAAALVIESLGARASPLLPELTAALEDERHDVRAAAAECLASIGPAAMSAVPALFTLRSDPSAKVREQAWDSLRRLVGRRPASAPENAVRVLP